jgi:hypothetical protein
MTDRLLTETGDNLTTESGDYLRTEQSTVTFEIECTGSAGVVSAKSVSGTAEVSSISGMVGAVGVKTGTGTVGITGISEMAPVSVTLANMRLSLADGVAFIDASQAGTLTPYIGSKIVIRDSAGKKAIGYIKAAGTGETYSGELISNTSFSDVTGWTPYRCTVASVTGGQSGNCLQVTLSEASTNQSVYNTSGIVQAGKLYIGSAYIKSGTSGNQSARIQLQQNIIKTQITSALWVEISGKITAGTLDTTFYCVKYSATAGTMLFDEVSLKQILTPSVTGVTIVSTQGGSTQNWASIESGFNYNDESGYSIIVGEFAIIGQKDAVSTCQIDGTADSATAQLKGGESSLSCDAIASVEATVSKSQSTTIEIESVGEVGVKPAIKINFELSSEGVISLHGYAASNETRYAKRSGRKSTYRRNSMRRAA